MSELPRIVRVRNQDRIIRVGALPASSTPSGSAGGDLSGIYPNPGVEQILGLPVIADPADNPTALPWPLTWDGTQWTPYNLDISSIPRADNTNEWSASQLFDEPLDLTELASAPSDPDAGNMRIYPKTDHSLHILSSGGNDTWLGADTLHLPVSRTPSSAGATGTAGEICWDSGFIYVCVATNSWKRVAIASW